MSTTTNGTEFQRQDAAEAAPVASSMVASDGSFAPKAPTTIEETGIERQVLLDLVLKLAYSTTKFSTQWAAQQLCLPLQIVGELLDELRHHQFVEVRGQAGPFSYYYVISGPGRELAVRLLEVSKYVGPAPVSLEAYNTTLQWQILQQTPPTPTQISAALEELVVSEDAVQVAGLATQARRSLFLYGPAGNGKTTIGHMLHQAADSHMWIPSCIGIDEKIIRVFDPECHEQTKEDMSAATSGSVDRRWKRVRRPFIVVGGELSLEALDLIYCSNLGYYEAPLHFKANGGTFLLDDFGCQKVAPEKMLNRWIHPLERGIDFLTLQTGQQIEVPFEQMLIVSTNLDPEKLMTPAFLRRMGYRLHMQDPSAEQYSRIFTEYAARQELSVPTNLIEYILQRYEAEDRQMKSCEPRDLIERVRDICGYRQLPLQLTEELIDIAWRGYFGNGH